MQIKYKDVSVWINPHLHSKETVTKVEKAVTEFADAEERLIKLCVKHELDCDIREEKNAGLSLITRKNEEGMWSNKKIGQWLTSTEGCS